MNNDDAPSSSLRTWLFICLAVFGVSVVGLLWVVNADYLAETPAFGGSFTEGVVGAPRFVNPLLSVSEADADLVALIFSGLLRHDEGGELIPDLAESFATSDDGLTYTFKLKEGLVWHDGAPLTAEDVVQTIKLVQNPVIKSPRFGNWDGVLAEAVDEHNVRFTLRQRNPLFPHQATLGILPWHLWSGEPPEIFAFNEKNIEAVGSGPYRVEKIKWRAGTPRTVDWYELSAFRHFSLGQPKVAKIRLRFFENESDLIQAYEEKAIDSLAGLDPATAQAWLEAGRAIYRAPLSRIFGVFLNQNQAPVFLNDEVRESLSLATDRNKLIETVLHGFGRPLSGPYPQVSTDNQATDEQATTTLTSAAELLEKTGWIWNETNGQMEKKVGSGSNVTALKFSLSTGNAPELRAIGEHLREEWTTLGAKVELLVFDRGDLDLNVIRPRQYDALLFGLVLGPEQDLFPFWHSSQRLDPGSNIALYANLKVDRLLEEARRTPEAEARRALTAEAGSEIASEQPAIFLYSPEFIYAAPPLVKNLNLQIINSPADRFRGIYRWYIETERVWPSFKDETYQ